jgi:nitronate monooxygenase
MAGGDSPALAAAVCDAGGLGSLGATYLTPEKMADAIGSVRAQTNRPFGINLFAPMPVPERPNDGAAERLAPYHAELGLETPALPDQVPDPFADRFPLVLDSGAKVFSFTFGIVPADAIAAAKARDMVVMGTATTVREAVALQDAGVDAVIAQGAEAGGHRGTFAGSFESSVVGTMALVPQTVDAVDVPVVASGGIMDGRGIAAALALGASAVQMGTAFLTCDETGAPGAQRDAILAAEETDTALTRAFSGRYARGIVNRFMTEMDDPMPFPWQNVMTRPMRTAAAKAGKAEYLSLWAGQGVRMARRLSARDLVERLVAEMETAIAGLARA